MYMHPIVYRCMKLDLHLWITPPELGTAWHSARPAQPAHERKRMEEIWAKQIAESQACKDFQESKPIISNEKDVKILARDASPFGTSVTKSWRCECCGELTSISSAVSSRPRSFS